MKEKVGFAYCSGTKYNYDRNGVQRGLAFQLIFCFFSENLI